MFSASPLALTTSANLMCPSSDFLRVFSPFGTNVAIFATFTGNAPGSAPTGWISIYPCEEILISLKAGITIGCIPASKTKSPAPFNSSPFSLIFKSPRLEKAGIPF